MAWVDEADEQDGAGAGFCGMGWDAGEDEPGDGERSEPPAGERSDRLTG